MEKTEGGGFHIESPLGHKHRAQTVRGFNFRLLCVSVRSNSNTYNIHLVSQDSSTVLNVLGMNIFKDFSN